MKLTKNKIEKLMNLLNAELNKENSFGEICIVGGAAMCILFSEREATKDVDAIFEPKNKIDKIIKKIAEDQNLPANWLNDAVKGYIVPNFEEKIIMELNNLRVWIPTPKYIFAMKALAARYDSQDLEDIKLLIKYIPIRTLEEAISIVEEYYPKNIISPKTQFTLEELFTL